MVFNVVARNQDDHTRNIAFLMDQEGLWRLAPAFDVIWAYNSTGKWTNRHQMSLNGKRDHFTRQDILSVAEQFGIKGASDILAQVVEAVARWPQVADEAGVPAELKKQIARTHRLRLT
jgi:serine/threonine-protein kinase HipA